MEVLNARPTQVLGVPAATAAFCMTALQAVAFNALTAFSVLSAACQVADVFVKLAVAPFADRLVKSGRLDESCLAS